MFKCILAISTSWCYCCKRYHSFLQLLAQRISLFATPKYSTLYKSNLLSSGCQFSFSLPLQGSTLGTILHIFCTDAHEQQKWGSISSSSRSRYLPSMTSCQTPLLWKMSLLTISIPLMTSPKNDTWISSPLLLLMKKLDGINSGTRLKSHCWSWLASLSLRLNTVSPIPLNFVLYAYISYIFWDWKYKFGV